MEITFHGAAREVTGSCFEVRAGETRFLVDAGLFQGGREAAPRNRAFPPFPPEGLHFAILTHAHLDHCGLLPRLARRAPGLAVYATKATADLLPVMLRSSAHIPARESTRGSRRREPGPPPLYDADDVERSLRHVYAMPYGVEFGPHPSVRVRFLDAGHILGSAIAEIRVREGGRERVIAFSGDLGQPSRPVVRDPETLARADVLVMEATYGNRLHKAMDATTDELVEAVRSTVVAGRGNLVVPAFALGRTQDLLVLLDGLCRARPLPRLDVFVDSPLAHEATFQSWVALPDGYEEVAPAFAHDGAATLPHLVVDGCELRVIAGEAFGRRSPVEVLWPTLYVDASMPASAALELPADHTERAVYVATGELEIDEKVLGEAQLARLTRGLTVQLRARHNSRVMLLAGEPFPTTRHMWWNFVASSRERIEQAKREWASGRFAPVPGESESIPLPDD